MAAARLTRLSPACRDGSAVQAILNATLPVYAFPPSRSFSRVAPNRPFSWKEGTWGALELSARFSFVDLDNRDIRGGTMNDTTLGVSWILTSNYRIVSNLIHSKLNGVGNARIIQLRVQVEY